MQISAKSRSPLEKDEQVVLSDRLCEKLTLTIGFIFVENQTFEAAQTGIHIFLNSTFVVLLFVCFDTEVDMFVQHFDNHIGVLSVVGVIEDHLIVEVKDVPHEEQWLYWLHILKEEM